MQYIDTVINTKQNNFMFDHHNRNTLQKANLSCFETSKKLSHLDAISINI